MLTYQEAKEKLGNKLICKLAGNTYLSCSETTNNFIITFYYVGLIIIHPDGTYTLNSSGHRTATTKRRLNQYSPAYIFQEKGVWYVGAKDSSYLPFYDGIKVDSQGNPNDPILRDMITDKEPAGLILARIEELQS